MIDFYTQFVKSQEQGKMFDVKVDVPNKKGGATTKVLKISGAKLDVIKSIAERLLLDFDKLVDYKEEKDDNGNVVCTGRVEISTKKEIKVK